MAQDITIPIKKPDGSIVKVSMADFMAYKRTGVLPDETSQTQSTGEPAAVPAQPAPSAATQTEEASTQEPVATTALAEETPMDIVPASEETELAVSAPNTEIYEDMAAAKAAESASAAEMPGEQAPAQTAPMPAEPATTPEQPEMPADESPMPVTSEAMPEMPAEEPVAANVSMPEPEETLAPVAQPKPQLDPSALAAPVAGDSALHEEPLEHNDLLDPTTETTLPPTHDAHVDAIISRAEISLTDELQERLRLLVQSRVKEVRDDDAVMVQAIKPADQGGLGLSEKDAINLLTAMRTEMNLKPLHFAGMSAPSSAIQTKNEPMVDQKKRSYLPPATPLSSSEKPVMQDVVPGAPMSTMPAMDDSSASAPQTMAPSGTAYQTMGPIDEIAHFTLEDLHRLGNDKERVVSIMKTKFTVLKDESFVLFLDAITAWKTSPLFMEYQNVIVTALNNKQTINQVLQGNNSQLQMQDIDIIVEINKVAN